MGDALAQTIFAELAKGRVAIAKLDAIRNVIKHGDAYCSDNIKAILGLEVQNDAGTDRE